MNDKFMKIAIEEAKKAFSLNEVPVGAVIVKNGNVISKAHNMKVANNNPLYHAEMLAINDAINTIGDWRLNDCELFVTLEPCPMCAGAIAQSRIKKIYIGTSSNIKCNSDLIKKIMQNEEYYHYVEIEYINDKQCSEMLSKFFVNKR